jgi:hypothetical protein
MDCATSKRDLRTAHHPSLPSRAAHAPYVATTGCVPTPRLALPSATDSSASLALRRLSLRQVRAKDGRERREGTCASPSHPGSAGVSFVDRWRVPARRRWLREQRRRRRRARSIGRWLRGAVPLLLGGGTIGGWPVNGERCAGGRCVAPRQQRRQRRVRVGRGQQVVQREAHQLLTQLLAVPAATV